MKSNEKKLKAIEENGVRLTDEELTKVSGGGLLPGEVSGDTEAIGFSGKPVPKPPAAPYKPDGDTGDIQALCPNCQKIQTCHKSAPGYVCAECGTVL